MVVILPGKKCTPVCEKSHFVMLQTLPWGMEADFVGWHWDYGDAASKILWMQETLRALFWTIARR